MSSEERQDDGTATDAFFDEVDRDDEAGVAEGEDETELDGDELTGSRD